jgi:hypothetical protein
LQILPNHETKSRANVVGRMARFGRWSSRNEVERSPRRTMITDREPDSISDFQI